MTRTQASSAARMASRTEDVIRQTQEATQQFLDRVQQHLGSITTPGFTERTNPDWILLSQGRCFHIGVLVASLACNSSNSELLLVLDRFREHLEEIATGLTRVLEVITEPLPTGNDFLFGIRDAASRVLGTLHNISKWAALLEETKKLLPPVPHGIQGRLKSMNPFGASEARTTAGIVERWNKELLPSIKPLQECVRKSGSQQATIAATQPTSPYPRGVCLLSIGLPHQSPSFTDILTTFSDGGGVRGIAALYILREIMWRIRYLETSPEGTMSEGKKSYESLPAPHEFFDLARGTSTGG